MRRARLLTRLLPLSWCFTALLGCAEDFVCAVDYDCPASEVCNVSSGQCEAFTCEVATDCPNPTDACITNRCTPKAGQG